MNTDAPASSPGIVVRRIAVMAVGKPSQSPARHDGSGLAAEQPVFAAGDDRFFLGPNSLTWFGASRGPAGVVPIELHRNGADQPVLHTRRGPIPPDPVVSREVLERYVGRYQLEGTIATISLTADNRLTVQLTGQPMAVPLRTIGPTSSRATRQAFASPSKAKGRRPTRLVSQIGTLVNAGPRLSEGS
jgi:hypothetical protein